MGVKFWNCTLAGLLLATGAFAGRGTERPLSRDGESSERVPGEIRYETAAGAGTDSDRSGTEDRSAGKSGTEPRGKEVVVSEARTKENTASVSLKPKIDGAVKAKVEFSLYDGEYRFNVRNSRFGVSGNVSRHIGYRIQVDFNNEGKVSILDSYVGYKTGGFSLQLGQQQYHFSTDLDRGPSTNMFANRSFLAKYLTGYYGSELSGTGREMFVKTIGSRDLGVMATYDFRKYLPLKVYFGIFNGSGSNNPEWGNSANFVGRLEYGRQEGLRAAIGYYNGYAPRHTEVVEKNGVGEEVTVLRKMNMVGCELRYVSGDFFVEGEYARRYLKNAEGKNQVLTAALVHGYYKFRMQERSAVRYVSPIARWDMGNNVDYLNTVSRQREAFSANRITAGVNFGFGEKLTGRSIRSELRLNYEKYLLKKRPSDFADNKLLQDKFTVEVVAVF